MLNNRMSANFNNGFYKDAYLVENEDQKIIKLTLDQIKDKHLTNPNNTFTTKKNNMIPLLIAGVIIYLFFVK